MVYVTHKTPSTRTYDTFTGKIIGWLEEYLFWLDIEGKCNFIDALWPEVWPIQGVDDIFINMFRKHYNNRYQTVYNQGANRGNAIHKQIFGRFDQVIADYKKRIADASSKLTSMINDAKNRISTLQSNIDDFDTKIRSFSSKIANFDTKINEFQTSISRFQSMLNDLKTKLSNASTKIDDLNNVTAKLDTRVSDLDSQIASFDRKIADAHQRVKNVEANLSDFETRLAQANNILKEHTSQINDLIERVKRLEAQKQPFQLPTLRL